MEQFTELPGGRIIRENNENGTVQVEWREMGQEAHYWFPKDDVVHLSRLSSPGVRIGVLTTSYLEALRDASFRSDQVVDF